MKFEVLRVDRNLCPGIDDRPAVRREPDPAKPTEPVVDETVIGIDPDLFNWPSGMTGAGGRKRVGRFSGVLLPGYGLGPLLGGTALVGEGIGNIGTDRELVEVVAGDPDVVTEGEKVQLAIQSRRIRLRGLGFEGLEFGPEAGFGDARGPCTAGLDIMQVAIGGARFADALQMDGRSRDTVLAGTGLAAHVISAAAHAVPSLRPLLPYAKGVSIGLKLYRSLMDQVGRPARIDAVLT